MPILLIDAVGLHDQGVRKFQTGIDHIAHRFAVDRIIIVEHQPDIERTVSIFGVGSIGQFHSRSVAKAKLLTTPTKRRKGFFRHCRFQFQGRKQANLQIGIPGNPMDVFQHTIHLRSHFRISVIAQHLPGLHFLTR